MGSRGRPGSRRSCPIRAFRTLSITLLVTLAAFPLAASPASAQADTHFVELSAADDRLSIMPSASISLLVTAHNAGPLPARVALGGASVPIDWFYDFAPQDLTIAPDGTNQTTLTVSAPAGAPLGDVTLTFVAQETDGLSRKSNVLSVNFTVVPPPPPEAKPAPIVTLSIGPASGASGSVVEGFLTLESSEASTLDVTLDIDGKAAWGPRMKDDIREIKLFTHTPRTMTARVTIPTSAGAGSVESFTVTATIGEFTYARTWNVTALGSPASTETTTSDDDGTSDSATPVDAAPRTPTAPTTPPSIGLLATPSVGTADIAPDEMTRVDIHLENTGGTSLHLRLVASVPDDTWTKSLGSDSVVLAPGATVDIPFTVGAPRDLPVGGTGTARVVVTGDNGLLRTVPITLRIIPAPPRDESAPSASDAQSPLPAPAGISPVTATLVIGLGAVGAGALALANRPLREKLVWGAAGLYTRLARPDVLGHDERQRLYTLIETRPGIHFHALQRDLNWNTGTLTYHIRVLEKHGFVVDRRDGAYRRFYISGAAPRKETFSVDAPQGLRADVLEAVQNRHGISQSDLALALGANKQTVNYHVKALERTGAIRIEKRGRDTFLYPVNSPGVAPGEVHA